MMQERLKELLTYSPETGLFHWLESRGRVRAGSEAGHLSPDGYVRIRVDEVLYLAHRLAWLYVKGCWPAELIDHKNLSRADNRFENLRECSNVENAHNTPSHADAGNQFKGVSLTTSNRWAARICVNREPKHLGNYDTPELAAAAYDAAARALHGDFARTNGVA